MYWLPDSEIVLDYNLTKFLVEKLPIDFSAFPETRFCFIPIPEQHFGSDCLKRIPSPDSIGNLYQSVHGFRITVSDLEVEEIENRVVPVGYGSDQIRK